jgi:glucan 1,3-beta-glucosidase
MILHRQSEALRGVNLGNWLLMELWMSPSLQAHCASSPTIRLHDEYQLSSHLGSKAEAVVRQHRETWITEDDFAWLSQRGINAVRIPFGYWILDPDGPYVGSPELLDFAIDCCERYGLAAVLDLHGLPGAQGPEHHTGRAGYFQWPQNQDYYQRSLDIIEQVAQRYAGKACIAGFSVVNEPHESIERETLISFYREANERMRRHMPEDEVALVIAAYPEGLMDSYHSCLGEMPNVWTDVHLYQSFCGWPNEDLVSYLQAAQGRQAKIKKWMEQGPAIVGEWSLSWPEELRSILQHQDQAIQDRLIQAYGKIQLAQFEQMTGWFFWSYRADDRPRWSFRDAVQRGWLPDRFDHLADTLGDPMQYNFDELLADNIISPAK